MEDYLSTPPSPPQPPKPTLEGPLARGASKLLSHGFVAVYVELTDGTVEELGFAGDDSRREILASLYRLGRAAKGVGANGVDVQISGGRRLVYRHELDAASGVWARLTGEELGGDHRKSTRRNVRRLFKNLFRRRAAV